MTIQIKTADTIRTDFIAFLRSAIEENEGPNVTDYSVGSVLNVLVEAFADVLENYYFDLFQVTRDSLENIYNGFNFFKIPGKKSLVTLTIYVDASVAALADANFFSIARGTKVQTEDGSVQFEIVDDYSPSSITISSSGEFSGKAQYVVQAMCVDSGTAGNTAENAITKFSSDIVNINSFAYWIRSASASGGADAEDESAMKLRFQKYLISLRRGTKESLEYALSSNAAFTGLMYSINGFRFLNIVRQHSESVDTNNYEDDLTIWNKFYPAYSLLTDASTVDATTTLHLYVGAEDKFSNLLFNTQTVPAGKWQITSVEYFNSVNQDWENVTISNAVTLPSAIVEDQYLAWTLDTTRWGKFQILDYNNYFIRIGVQKTDLSVADLEVYKVMTYPFPGYIDIYCLKNYRDAVTTTDKTLITESIESFKAAGVITTVADATVVQIHPLIIINTSNLTQSIVPSDIITSIRADIVAFANTKTVGADFIRNELYAYLYQRYNQYGNLYVYYRYDPSIYEDLANDVFKEGFRDSMLDAAVNEKIDLLLSDIYVVSNLNTLTNTLTGYAYLDSGSNYSDYYKDLAPTTLSDLYLAY
jgi:hypothetical protein